MKLTDRQMTIMSQIRLGGRAQVADLAAQCDVSEMTIRRDLEALEALGLVKRVHGGAVAGWNRGYEPPFALRVSRDADAKSRIGVRCASMIEEGETIYLDIGTTAMAVAHALTGRRDLTVITPNLRAADYLLEHSNVRVFCLGGPIHRGERSVGGPIAERNLAEFYFDTCVLGVAGVSLQAGLTDFNIEGAALKRIAIDHAQRLIVAADQNKIGHVALAVIAPLSRVTTLVTDAPETHDSLQAVRRAGTGLELV